MTTPYTPAANGRDVGAVPTFNESVSSDVVTPDLWNLPDRAAFDWLAMLQEVAKHSDIREGFAAMPPTAPKGCWSAPSREYPADLAWVSGAGDAVYGGTMASIPAGQLNGQDSSMGLKVFLGAPSRIAFDFGVYCTANVSFLRFYIDGVEYMKTGGDAGGGTARRGRFVSPILRAGAHSFSWRYSKGDAAAADVCAVKAVSVFPAMAQGQHIVPSTNGFIIAPDYQAIRFWDSFEAAVNSKWSLFTLGTGAGYKTGATDGVTLQSGSGSTGDYCRIDLGAVATLGYCIPAPDYARASYLDAVVELGQLTNCIAEVGFRSFGAPDDLVCLRYDSAGAGYWSLVCKKSGSAENVYDTGVPAYAGRQQIIVSLGLRGIFGMAMRAVQTGAGVTCAVPYTVVLPAGRLTPFASIASKTSAGARTLKMHSYEVFAER